jgi:hypothetical protein
MLCSYLIVRPVSLFSWRWNVGSMVSANQANTITKRIAEDYNAPVAVYCHSEWLCCFLLP